MRLPGRLGLWAWLWRKRLFWFQRRKPAHEHPMRLYVGKRGSGKSLTMVDDCIRLMRQGVEVHANLKIRDPLTGVEAVPCYSWIEMLERAVEVLEYNRGRPVEERISRVFAFDELHQICDSREWANTPRWVAHFLATSRHYGGCALMGSTQALDQVEKRLRTIVDEIVEVRPVPPLFWAGLGLASMVGGMLLAFWLLWNLHLAWVPAGLALVGLGVLVVARRPPIFVQNRLDASMVDVPGADARTGLGGPRWVLAYPFGGYSTQELVLGDDMSAYKTDDALKARIAGLTERAIAASDPGEIDAYADTFADAA